MYDFNKLVDRKGTNSAKWDMLEELFGRDDLLPMWVADMDFNVAPAIVEALEKRVGHNVYGYTYPGDEYYDSIIGWMKRRHNWDVEKEWITFTPGVVPGLRYALEAYTKPGDKIIIQSPVYHPFSKVIEDNGRYIVDNTLIYEDGKYIMDYEGLENSIDSRTKLLFLCNPHNPVGRVWTREELRKLGKICLKNNIIIVSDEIHGDIIFEGHKQTTIAKVSPEISQNSVVCTAPSKTFNIAGLQMSNIIIPNKELRDKYNIEYEKSHISGPNILGINALMAAYNDSEDWLEELLVYLEGNLDFAIDFLEKRIPKLKVFKSEGTFLLWIDCSSLNMNPEELQEFFVDECRVALNNGEMFGETGRAFQRLNIGCPRSILKEGLERIEKGINSL